MDKDRVKGAADQAIGTAKETAGKVMGSKHTEAEGAAQNAEGKVESAAGKAKDAARDAVDSVTE